METHVSDNRIFITTYFIETARGKNSYKSRGAAFGNLAEAKATYEKYEAPPGYKTRLVSITNGVKTVLARHM